MANWEKIILMGGLVLVGGIVAYKFLAPALATGIQTIGEGTGLGIANLLGGVGAVGYGLGGGLSSIGSGVGAVGYGLGGGLFEIGAGAGYGLSGFNPAQIIEAISGKDVTTPYQRGAYNPPSPIMPQAAQPTAQAQPSYPVAKSYTSSSQRVAYSQSFLAQDIAKAGFPVATTMPKITTSQLPVTKVREPKKSPLTATSAGQFILKLVTPQAKKKK